MIFENPLIFESKLVPVCTKTMICDKCSKEQTINNNQYGGSGLGNWYHLSKELGSTQLEELRKIRNWDFCSIKCLQEFVQSLKID